MGLKYTVQKIKEGLKHPISISTIGSLFCVLIFYLESTYISERKRELYEYLKIFAIGFISIGALIFAYRKYNKYKLNYKSKSKTIFKTEDTYRGKGGCEISSDFGSSYTSIDNISSDMKMNITPNHKSFESSDNTSSNSVKYDIDTSIPPF